MKKTAEFYRALGDETRLRMLWLLMNHRELCVCDFLEVLGITPSKASRHLRNLYHAGLVTDRRDGLWAYYSLRKLDEQNLKVQMKALKDSLSENGEAEDLLARTEEWLARKHAKVKRECCA